MLWILKVSFMGIILDRIESLAACRDIASWTPSSDAILGINGVMPEVDIMILDLLTPGPNGSVRIRTALDTLFQLYKGSP